MARCSFLKLKKHVAAKVLRQPSSVQEETNLLFCSIDDSLVYFWIVFVVLFDVMELLVACCLPGHEGGNPGNRSAQDERVDIVCAFISIHRLKVHDMPDNMIFV